MKLLFTMRTADRSPKRNYLRMTLASLLAGGMDESDIHVFATDPAVGWIEAHPGIDIGFHLHVPRTHRRANENGLAPIALLEDIDAEWIVLSEDDLEWCADPIGSLSRWLTAHARPEVVMYRFFAFGPLTRIGPHVSTAPLREQRGSQAVALRATDARRFAAWAKARATDWRPKGAPFADRPHDGFDKLLGYWALQDRPTVTHGLVSRPFFVKHLGVQSSLHSRGVTLDAQFIGTGAAYPKEAPCRT